MVTLHVDLCGLWLKPFPVPTLNRHFNTSRRLHITSPLQPHHLLPFGRKDQEMNFSRGSSLVYCKNHSYQKNLGHEMS